MIYWELKKIIKNKSSIAVSMLFLILILIASISRPILETEYSYINDKGEYVQDTREKNIIANEKLLNKVNLIKETIIEENMESNDYSTKKISQISSEKMKLDDGKEYKDIEFYKIFNFRVNNMFSSVMIIGMIIIIFSNIYTDEKLSNVDSIIISSKNKNKALYSKLILSIVIPIAVYMLYISIVAITTILQYGIPINGNLQAYRISDIGFMMRNISINSYTILNIVTMIIIFTSISIFSGIASYISKGSVGAVVGSTIFVVGAKVLTLLKFLPKEILMILNSLNYVDIIQRPESFIGIYSGSINILGSYIDINIISYLGLAIIPVILILSTICIFNKVLDK